MDHRYRPRPGTARWESSSLHGTGNAIRRPLVLSNFDPPAGESVGNVLSAVLAGQDHRAALSGSSVAQAGGSMRRYCAGGFLQTGQAPSGTLFTVEPQSWQMK